MRSEASTVEEYIEGLPDDRREAISAVREVILENLPKGIEESMNWGMIAYEVPLAVFPNTYNKQPMTYAALASQKRHMAVYLSCIYSFPGSAKNFEEEYRMTGKRYDVGKSCVRFRTLEDLPLELIGKTIGSLDMQTFIADSEASRKSR
jgi:uncharacterized protein YdhG (YjbR/CyaY superfamily)